MLVYLRKGEEFAEISVSAGPATARALEAARQPIAATTNAEQQLTAIVTAYSLRARLDMSTTVQI